MADLLESLGVDIAFEKASGNYVFTREGSEDRRTYRAILDLVGGFGACLFGHNNSELKSHLVQLLDQNCPTFVQGAVRSEAGKLAKAMNDQLNTKGRYYCNFANSGAEAVEATLKHAYKVRFDEILKNYEDITRRLNEFYHKFDQLGSELELPDQFEDLSKFRDSIDEHNLGQFEDFQNNPVVCAFKGSFHGKTSSALKMTFNKTYRESFEGLSAIKTVFFEPIRPERVQEIVHANQVSFLVPEVEDNKVVLRSTEMTKVIGVIMEVILGEGGVKPVPEESFRYLADIHKDLGVPYIIDEIQTGFGRTGTFAAYSETPLSIIEPEYLIFGKALGGGLVKISAALIHESVYDPDFGLLHTSTYGDDELSCSVASKALEMLTRDDDRLMRDVVQKGAYFIHKLKALQNRYPSVIKEVRGRGLMLGLEFTDLNEFGNFFRYAGQKGFISLLLSSYLLHHHNVRVMAPLSTLYKGNPGKKRESIIRLQPAASITNEEIDRVIYALEEAVKLITRQDQYSILAHLFGGKPGTSSRPTNGFEREKEPPKTEFDARVGFLVNLTRLDDLIEYYLPSLKSHDVDTRRVTNWWNKLSRFLEPDVVHTTYVESEGFVVEANIIAVPYLADQMIRTYAVGRKPTSDRSNRFRLKELTDKIKDAAIVARDLGDERIPTSIVGLGSFTSIVTENALVMNDYEIPVTTGNTYTAGLMLEGIIVASEKSGSALSQSVAAVVGAGGNIGRTLSALLSLHAGCLYLVGRGGSNSDERLHKIKEECLTSIVSEIARQLASGTAAESIELSGFADKIYRSLLFPGISGQRGSDSTLNPVIEAILTGCSLPTETGDLLDKAIRKFHKTTDNPYIV
ncbi:MAG: aminotransferase class III-fold pyridoxal phosphate-dependent enzyme, partial [Bacteroidetes bacterium]|nr:aminotransferase class III-fold pyridoxal phosphate-dependent enzyme [Bacteroidota bacterium]